MHNYVFMRPDAPGSLRDRLPSCDQFIFFKFVNEYVVTKQLTLILATHHLRR